MDTIDELLRAKSGDKARDAPFWLPKAVNRINELLVKDINAPNCPILIY